MSTDYLDMYGEKVASEVRKTIEAKVSSMCREIVEEIQNKLVWNDDGVIVVEVKIKEKEVDSYLEKVFSEYGLEYNKIKIGSCTCMHDAPDIRGHDSDCPHYDKEDKA